MDDRSRADEILGWVGVFGLLGIVGGALVLGYQLYLWLKTAVWHPIPLSSLFKWFGSDLSLIARITWVGLRKVVVALLDLPLCIASIPLGLGIGYLVGEVVAAIRTKAGV